MAMRLSLASSRMRRAISGLAGVEGEGGDLSVVPGAVVVFGFGFVEAVFAGEEPVEEWKPAAHTGGVGGGEGFGGFKPVELIAEGDEEGGVDDADAAAVDAAGNGLAEVEVGIHAGGGVEEPVAQQFGCMSGEAFVAGFAEGEGEVETAECMRFMEAASVSAARRSGLVSPSRRM